jgi:ADP-ribosylglycohydrolase
MRNQDRSLISLPNVPQPLITKLLSHRRCLNLAKNDLYNRAYGAMFGFLIGDSMGAYNINRPISETHILEALVMEGGGVMNLKSGEATDEWEICLALSEGLNNCKGVYNHSIIAGKYLEWIESNPNDLPVLMGIAFSDIRRNRRCGRSLDNNSLGEQLLQSSTRNCKQ